jgi:putative phage-type endonuclease
MIPVQLIQGTPEWHEWRSQGIGGSEAAVVLGNSPYKSLYDLYAEKTGLVSPEQLKSGNEYIFAKGHETEARVRPILEVRIGCDLPPACGEHDDFPILRASLDGYNAEKNVAAEIKLVGKEAFELAQQGMIPPHYYDQCQHNLFVSGAEKLYYACATLDSPTEIAVVEIKPDQEWQQKYITCASEFWQRVQNQDPPPKTPPMPGVIVVDDHALRQLATQYALLGAKKAEIEAEYERVGEILAEGVKARSHTNDANCKWLILGTGVVISQYVRQGSIQYAKLVKDRLPDLPQEELENYRGKPSVITQIKVLNEQGKFR